MPKKSRGEDGLKEFFECGPMKQLKSMQGAKFVGVKV